MKKYHQTSPRKFITKVEQYPNATLVVWIARDEVGCEVIGEIDSLKDESIPELCLSELKNVPGIRQIEDASAIQMQTSVRFRRRSAIDQDEGEREP